MEASKPKSIPEQLSYRFIFVWIDNDVSIVKLFSMDSKDRIWVYV